MKKHALHLLWCPFITALLLSAVFQSTHAQASDPSTWDEFINSDKNKNVADTFRLQTFGNSLQDNWKYELSGNANVTTDNSKLNLPLGSSVAFETYPLDNYVDVVIGLRLARRNLTTDEKLSLEWIRNEKEESVEDVWNSDDKTSGNFFCKTISKNPTSVRILVSLPGVASKSGYCLADSVYAFGQIKKYSLFSGTGNWNDTIRWSHLPPLRNRNALINGHLSTGIDIQCSNTALFEGCLQVSPGSTFETNNLHLYNTGSLLTSAGTINIRNQIVVHKTFEEKGKWYFISFPFTVYPDNVDARFQQKDATPNDGGNYYYVQTYNGEKRALHNQSYGNWEVLPIRSGRTPLFEKNKGYLIALDDKAGDTTLTFASEPGEIPEDFAQNGIIPVFASTTQAETNKENHGWYLCGNPFPSELSLSQIKENSSLDGFIYLYENGIYQAYPINSKFTLPPYSAFFVKASADTDIQVTASEKQSDEILLQTSHPVSLHHAEPSVANGQATSTNAPAIHRIYIRDKILYLENVPEQGTLTLYDLTGKCICRQPIQPHTNHLPLSVKSGFYIMHIQTQEIQIREKITLL